MCKVHKQEEKKIKFGVVKNRYQINATNEVSGTSEFLSLEPPVRITRADKSSWGGAKFYKTSFKVET